MGEEESVNGGIDIAETTQLVINERGEGGSGKKFAWSQRHPEKKKERRRKFVRSQRRPEKRQEDDHYFAVQMLKTQQNIFNSLQELTAAHKRNTFIQERFLAFEEYKTYGRVITEPAEDGQPWGIAYMCAALGTRLACYYKHPLYPCRWDLCYVTAAVHASCSPPGQEGAKRIINDTGAMICYFILFASSVIQFRWRGSVVY